METSGKLSESETTLDLRHLEALKLRLDIAKLKHELRRYRWPGWWELTKTTITWVGIGVGLVTLLLSVSKANREAWASAVADFMGDRPIQGARLVAGYGKEGVTTLVEGVQLDPEDAVARRRALAALSVLQALEAESDPNPVLEDFHLDLLGSQKELAIARAEGLVEKHLSPDEALSSEERRELGDLGRILQRLNTLLKARDKSLPALVDEIKAIVP